MQKGMLYHYLKEPGSRHYFEQLSLTLSGEIDFNRFKQAWNIVVEINATLRTQFEWSKISAPVQIIMKNHEVPVVFHDLSITDVSDKGGTFRGETLKEIKDRDRNEGFDLNRVPFRIMLCKIENGRYEMILSTHHILYDGWSNRIILEDFFSAYHDLPRDESPSRPSRQKYKEFVSHISRLDSAKQQRYWSDYLKGFEEKPELSIKRKKAAADSTRIREANCTNCFFSLGERRVGTVYPQS